MLNLGSLSLVFIALIAAIALSPLRVDGDVIMYEDFEDSTVEYTGVTQFWGSNSAHFTIVPLFGTTSPDDGPYSGFGDSNFFAAENMDSPGGPETITQTLIFNINIANYSELTFDFLFAAGDNAPGGSRPLSYDDEDGLRVRAQIDGGAFQNLIAFEAIEPGGDTSNNELRQDTDFNGVGDPDGFLPTSGFTAFDGLAVSGTGTNLLLEIEVTSSSVNESLAFDNILIQGTSSVPEPSSIFIFGIGGIAFGFRRRRQSYVWKEKRRQKGTLFVTVSQKQHS